MPKVSKKHFIKNIIDKHNVDTTTASAIFETVLETISEGLIKERAVDLGGICSLVVRTSRGRRGIDPFGKNYCTGEAQKIKVGLTFRKIFNKLNF